MTYSAGSRKDIRRAEKIAKVDERARIDFVVAAMSTLQGRSWFYDILAICHIFADPFTGDPHLDNFNKGQRNIGLMLYNDIVTHCPDSFVQMMREAKIKEATNAIRHNNDRASTDDNDNNDSGPEYAGSPYDGWDAEGSGSGTTGDDAADD